jgi:hypothetical protein
VVGQNFETFDLAARQAEARHFYLASSPAAALKTLATLEKREHVTVVIYSPLERAQGAVELRKIPGFRTVYDLQGVIVFRRTAGRA